MISLSGTPYDSLQEMIGIISHSSQSLKANGVHYEQIELIDDDFDTGEFENFTSEEEPRERCLKVRCTGGEFESIKRYCYALELKPYEEDLKNE